MQFPPSFCLLAGVDGSIVFLKNNESSLLGLFHPKVQQGLFHHLDVFSSVDASFWHDDKRTALPPHKTTPHHHSLSPRLECWRETGGMEAFRGRPPDPNLSGVF